MSYAIKNDGTGWRAVASAADIDVLTETFSLTIPSKSVAQVLADAKTAKNEQINKWRKDANSISFPWQGKQIACDPLSRSDIDGIAGYIGMNNALPATFPNAWKAVDSTVISIPDVATFKAMYQAMVDYGAANFSHSQALKTSLAAAVSIQEVDAIVW